MTIDPLSNATRAAKRNLLLVSSAAILVKTFNLTVERLPVGIAVITVDQGALNFAIVMSLVYFGIAFATYYWIDIRNVKITDHQTTVFKKYESTRASFRRDCWDELEKNVQRVAQKGQRVVFDSSAFDMILQDVAAFKALPNDAFLAGTEQYRCIWINDIEGRNSKLVPYNEKTAPQYHHVFNEVRRQLKRYRLRSIAHWSIWIIPLLMTKSLYLMRNYGLDGLLPLVLGLIAILNMYGVISMDWTTALLPS